VLLVAINVFVGGMVGIERTILPLLAEHGFGLASKTAVLSFLVSFGIIKALANLFSGRMGDRYGRKRILVASWLIGVLVPFLVIAAPNWGWFVFANVLLGINQGLCWSTTVIMKNDLVGPKQRGLAMGFNEAAGYLAVSGAALAAGYLATAYALRPQPFFLGVAFALCGLILSLVFVRESHAYVALEKEFSLCDPHRNLLIFGEKSPVTSPQPGQPMLISISPRVPVGDMEQAQAFYAQLGFATTDHDGESTIVERDGISLHLTVSEGRRVCWIGVTNIEALYQQYVPTNAL
jgi:MFS family permease